MAYVTTEVEVDLDNIDDHDLIDELESRGYIIFHKKQSSSISYLYSTYLTASQDAFDKELKKFFRNTIDANI
jgi:hypothetical protein